jgi:hypothetical protein
MAKRRFPHIDARSPKMRNHSRYSPAAEDEKHRQPKAIFSPGPVGPAWPSIPFLTIIKTIVKIIVLIGIGIFLTRLVYTSFFIKDLLK